MSSAFTSCNPATGEVVYTHASWSEAQLLQTINTLRLQAQPWRQLSLNQRAKQVLVLANALEQHRAELADLITLEVGKCTKECLAEIDKSVQLIRYYARLAPDLLEPLDIPTQATHSAVAFEALGIVLAVMPWNYPIWQVLRFAIPALLAGNACLVKPAPSVPQSTQMLMTLAQQSHLDTLQVAWLEPPLVEEAIRRCDAVAFTGSTQTGQIIASLAGKYIKKSVLELGGSNPFIVLADADIETAAHDAVHSRFRDAGQSCNAAKRLIVVPEVADYFITRVCELAAQLKTGDPKNATTTLAPLARADLRENLHAQVMDALKQGATLTLGGHMPNGIGFFYPATVLDHVNPDCRVYHEEVFGPVATILRAKNEEDAIRLANDSYFGLGASLYTTNHQRGWELARHIEAGSVFINRHTSSDLRLPFGGVKSSGYGRELSEFGLYEFVNIKTYWQK